MSTAIADALRHDRRPAKRIRSSTSMQVIPRKIKLAAENNSVAVEWSDDHRSLYPYKLLREKCPCATCTDAHGTGAPKTNIVVESPLPMFQKPLRPEKAVLMGRYAVNISWSDGHTTGIYSFDYLREICPCEECGAKNNER